MVHDFGGIIGSFSPTTLRYIAVASSLYSLFGDLSGWRVAEVGGGYGGQAYILLAIFRLKEYAIWDIPEASQLQRRYLQDRFNYGGTTTAAAAPSGSGGSSGSDGVRTSNTIQGRAHPELTTNFHSTLNVLIDKPFDLVISNYAISELGEEAQVAYGELLLRKAKHAYMILNGAGTHDMCFKMRRMLARDGHYIVSRSVCIPPLRAPSSSSSSSPLCALPPFVIACYPIYFS
jgi:hypothetical protein